MTPSTVPAADRIAGTCYDRFAALPKAGRPAAGTEWTILAAILQYSPLADDLHVVALGTGTKCLSHNLLSAAGDRLNDSHAEIMARRGFVRYLLHQMRSVKTGGPSIFTYDAEAKRFSLRDDVGFHFFSTHPLCGDASIFETDHDDDDDGHDDVGQTVCKRARLHEAAEDGLSHDAAAGDIVRGFTGGKLLECPASDAGADLMGQQPGAVRTKPGRGIRTLSVSCSDKLSRWSLVGLQGALLHGLLATGGVFVQSITMAGQCNVAAAERAIWRRWSGRVLPETPDRRTVRQSRPVVQRASKSMVFAAEQRDGRLPSPSSVVWCNVQHKDTEVAVAGKRQGVTKKQLATKVGRLQICKVELLRQYQQLILTDFPDIGLSLGVTERSTYEQCKRASVEYSNACEQLKRSYFECWTVKPSNLNQFCCD